jgi:hypothetical protein
MKTLDIMAIPLRKDLFVLVDGKNYEILNKYKWSFNHGYAVRGIESDKAGATISMHRQILGLQPKDKNMTDHKNHCGLDNRETNLRICTNSQNQMNSRLRINNTSGYKGVSRNRGRWIAQIRSDGKILVLGRFKKKVVAAKAYDKKAKEIFGEYAYLNFPPEQ